MPVSGKAGLALALILAGSGFAPVASASPGPATDEISMERSFVRLTRGLGMSRSAHAFRAAAVRVSPRPRAATAGRLRILTEDGFPEVYLLLARREVGGRAWVRVSLPGRPNGRSGWVPRDALGPFRVSRVALLVDRSALTATFLRRGRPRWRAPVGVGAAGTPTPGGRFWVREKFPVEPGSIYGRYAFGTSAYSRLSEWPGGGVVGIHGTDSPWLIPGRPSHGCVRMRNRDVLRLAARLPTGAQVLIR